MATFPTLRTGAVVQYPLETSTRFRTESVRFLDGSRQCFATAPVLRRWTIRLAGLDEQELAALTEFAEEQGTATFAFTDPVTGASAAKCVIAEPGMAAMLQGEISFGAEFVVEEVG